MDAMIEGSDEAPSKVTEVVSINSYDERQGLVQFRGRLLLICLHPFCNLIDDTILVIFLFLHISYESYFDPVVGFGRE